MDIDISQIDVEFEGKKKNYILIFLFSIVVILIFYAILFYNLDVKIITYLNLTTVFILFSGFIFFNQKKINTQVTIDSGIIVCSLITFANYVVFCEQYPIVFLWFVNISLASFIIQTYKASIFWLITGILLFFLASYTAEYFGIKITMNFSENTQKFLNYSNTFFFLSLLLISLYFLNEFQKLRLKRAFINYKKEDFKQVEDTETNEKNTDKNLKFKDGNRLVELFNQIEKYYVEKKPYQDPDFNAYKLALGINNNISNISKAISFIKNQNFNTYTNYYRVNDIKQKLLKKEHEKFKLKHLYQEVGFTSQSTFNRAFKEVEGITPTEFIERLE